MCLPMKPAVARTGPAIQFSPGPSGQGAHPR